MGPERRNSQVCVPGNEDKTRFTVGDSQWVRMAPGQGGAGQRRYRDVGLAPDGPAPGFWVTGLNGTGVQGAEGLLQHLASPDPSRPNTGTAGATSLPWLREASC